MHELGIVFHLIDLLERVGRENSLTRIQRVALDLGEVSGVMEDQLLDCWKWASSRSPLLEEAELAVNRIAATTVCNACGRTYATIEHGRICPHCTSSDTVLLRGNEMEVIEVEGY